jgi:predicted HTH transcriptional regulator
MVASANASGGSILIDIFEEFGTRSLLRNSNIANLFKRISLIEKMGTGIQKIQTMMLKAGLPAVQFKFMDFVVATFIRCNIQQI